MIGCLVGECDGCFVGCRVGRPDGLVGWTVG